MSSASSRGVFIVIDGIDGAGKSTQVQRLCDSLRTQGFRVTQSREPTDGQWGKMIRNSATTGRLSLDEELRAFVEDRREHVSTLIQPALADGQIVIVDRYFYSTVAYQGIRGADTGVLLDQMRAEFPIPDLTLFFDLPVSVALQRISETRGEIPNEFEQEDALTEIRKTFHQMADQCDEVQLLDCTPDRDEVTANIAAHVEQAIASRR
ncbi:thymidylate kinase [Rhodopirellula maiorica SM1]|uniref:Thymidylate kinase n=1 Tax=Rhodopirellula maiorica SM1 TaxID=1265738 RepID=M5RWT2_9BACT|nr:dTMP kinase [Rhodopirellula maiorica]EMI18409.1 thymidylate kinase [Rhodopirellula maiorica SM1]